MGEYKYLLKPIPGVALEDSDKANKIHLAGEHLHKMYIGELFINILGLLLVIATLATGICLQLFGGMLVLKYILWADITIFVVFLSFAIVGSIKITGGLEGLSDLNSNWNIAWKLAQKYLVFDGTVSVLDSITDTTIGFSSFLGIGLYYEKIKHEVLGIQDALKQAEVPDSKEKGKSLPKFTMFSLAFAFILAIVIIVLMIVGVKQDSFLTLYLPIAIYILAIAILSIFLSAFGFLRLYRFASKELRDYI